MATERDDCIDRIVKASAGKLSRDEAMDALDEILARAERGPAWKGMDEKLAQAAAELEDQLAERAAIARRNERMAALKAIARHKYYDRAPSPAQGLEAKLGGINVPFAGGRLSVDSEYQGLQRLLAGPFYLGLMNARTAGFPNGGIEKLFLSRKLEREWATELHELNKPKGGRAGITGSQEALAIAELVQAAQQRAIGAINGEGGWVKSYSGYIARTSHDTDRIYRAGREQWIEDVMRHLDVVRTFHDRDPNKARAALEKLWPQFSHGDHFDYSRPLDDVFSLLDVDFAKRASAPRELHWTNADGWLAYNEKYGRFTPTYAVISALDQAARVTALMKEFGPTPRAALEEDLRYLRGKHHDQPDTIRELDRAETRIRNLFAQFDGGAQRPESALLARIGAVTRSVIRMAKLGLTPITMITDLAYKTAELRYQGIGVFERFWGEAGFADYFRGYGFVRGQNPDHFKRQVADLLLHTFDAEIGMIAQRFDPGEAPGHNALARAEQWFFRVTGMNSMTFNQRHAAERMMAAHWGSLRKTAFAEIEAPERRVFALYDIGKPEWDVLNKVDWNQIEGKTYLTPEVATRLSDDDIRDYLVAAGKLHKDATGPTVEFAVGRGRDDLVLKLHSYFAERGKFAIPEPTARERAILYKGANRDFAPGTVMGEAWRLFLQFKTFPATVMLKTWSREIYGGQGSMGRLAGLTELVVYATALGAVSGALNMLVKGQDPVARWKDNPAGAFGAAFIRGGAGSIYGDFLLQEFSRHGLPASASILGPTFGQIDRVFEIYSDLTHMKARTATAALGARMVRDNTPFANMIYSKAAVDYLIYYRFMEWLNPGYLERFERTMKDKHGMQFWLKPSQVSR